VRLISKATLILLILSLALTLGCSGDDPGPVGFTTERVTIKAPDRNALVAVAREYFEHGNFDETKLTPVLTEKYDKEVFIWIFHPGVRPMHGRAHEKTIAKSLAVASENLKTHGNFIERYKGKVENSRFAIYVMDKVVELKTRDLDKIRRKVEPGFHGLIMASDGRLGYQLGEEILFRGWGMPGFNDKQRVSGAKMAARRLEKLSATMDLSRQAWKAKETGLWYFSVHTAVEKTPGGEAFASYRAGRLPGKDLTRSDVLEAAWLAGRHLSMHTDENGRLGYHYRAAVDKFAPEKNYNIVRHAGAVWGLFMIYNATGDVELFEAGKRALGYLRKEIKIATEDPTIAYLDYRGRSILGTNALTLLSLIEIPQEALTEDYRQIREKLGNSIIAFQIEDGRFYKTWKEKLAGGPVPDPQPLYYPGEAFLSLVKLYEVDPQQKWLDAAIKCATQQMINWDGKPEQQPDAWVVQAMSRLYAITKDEKLPEYVFRMVKWHFRNQWGMPQKKGGRLPFRDYFGGADNSTPPRSTPTSARNEANAEAWRLAKLVGDKDIEKELGDSVMAAYWHNRVDQIRPDTAYFYPAPEKAIGGIRGSLITNDIRIDYNQHFLSSSITGLDLAEERNGIGEFGSLSKGKILDVHKLGIDAAEAAKRLAGQPTVPAGE
jgi:hypothetical protein